MKKFTVNVFINHSPQDVFDYLSNVANFQQWMPLMQSAAWTSSGMPGIGSTYKVLSKMPGGWKRTTKVSHQNSGLICAGWCHCGRDIELMVEATGQSLRREVMS